MTMLDDQLDDLLRSFRADEAFIDDEIRGRIWEEVVATTTLAATPLPRRTDPRTRRARRVLTLAAALLVAALSGGVVARVTVDDPGTVTAGVAATPDTATTGPAPTLDELTDAAAAHQGPVLGDPGATHAHVVASFVYHVPTDAEEDDVAGQLESWVTADGTGRLSGNRTDNGNAVDQTFDEPNSLLLGPVTPSVALALPADGRAVLEQMVPALGTASPSDPASSTSLVDLLAQPGLPGAARAGLLGALGELGFETQAGASPNTVRLSGPAADGATVTAELDIETGRTLSRIQTDPDGGTAAVWYSSVDLRATAD